MRPPNPLNSGEVYGELALPKIPELTKNSQVKVGKDYSNARLSVSLDKETNTQIIEISVLPTSKKSINITGWKIKGVIDSVPKVIEKGVPIFKQGKVNEEKDVVVYPGEKALILPGYSPIGVSFKLNKCSGYLEQFQAFTPHLSQSCPRDYLEGNLDLSCTLFLKTITNCNAYIKEFPRDVSKECQDVVNRRLNYNACVEENYQDTNFGSGEWRVYMNSTNSFGSKGGDMISIYDADNNLISTIFYSQ
ncbi:MAG: hypothetical protein WCO84_04110 [bacterium]